MDPESGEVLPRPADALDPRLSFRSGKEKHMKVNEARKEEVLREFPPAGKYRIRLLSGPRAQERTLDIREYVSSETFEGFTRRGIRLGERAQVELLQEVLTELLRDSLI